MSTADDDVEDDEEARQKLEQAAASTATSDQESVRQATAKYMQSWSHLIMASEETSLRTLTRRVQLLMLTLILMASAGYFFTSFYLFRDIAKKNILLIDKTGLYAPFCPTPPQFWDVRPLLLPAASPPGRRPQADTTCPSPQDGPGPACTALMPPSTDPNPSLRTQSQNRSTDAASAHHGMLHAT